MASCTVVHLTVYINGDKVHTHVPQSSLGIYLSGAIKTMTIDGDVGMIIP